MNTGKYLKYMLISMLLISMAAMQSAAVSADNTQEINYSISNNVPSAYNPQFMVKAIKYEPYPVNAGQWFDVWIKVQNIGLGDAPSTIFELRPEYPFYSNDSLVRDYGLVNGVTSAHKADGTDDLTQVILKYRVMVADNAPAGISNLKFIANPNSKSKAAESGNDIPIQIEKTKTDFNVMLRDITPQESSFVITNAGENAAKSVTLEIEKQAGLTFLKEVEPSSLGNLEQGDFIIAHVKVIPNQGVKEMTARISYTDTAGVRNTIEKKIPVDDSMLYNVCTTAPAKDYLKWVFGLVGLLTGIFLVVIITLIRQKLDANKKKH
ncbi:MAG: hypothetical protein NT001_03820 [Candidatus Woesearchaeota archaeon]|nr:hypothetical protein [Candidatus Woesearchaeota archaeon]